jgi:DNA gyrase inhibitor GyrI
VYPGRMLTGPKEEEEEEIEEEELSAGRCSSHHIPLTKTSVRTNCYQIQHQ